MCPRRPARPLAPQPSSNSSVSGLGPLLVEHLLQSLFVGCVSFAMPVCTCGTACCWPAMRANRFLLPALTASVVLALRDALLPCTTGSRASRAAGTGAAAVTAAYSARPNYTFCGPCAAVVPLRRRCTIGPSTTRQRRRCFKPRTALAEHIRRMQQSDPQTVGWGRVGDSGCLTYGTVVATDAAVAKHTAASSLVSPHRRLLRRDRRVGGGHE